MPQNLLQNEASIVAESQISVFKAIEALCIAIVRLKTGY